MDTSRSPLATPTSSDDGKDDVTRIGVRDDVNSKRPDEDDVNAPMLCDVISQEDTWVFHGCLVHATPEQEMEIMEDTAIGVHRGKIVFVEPSRSLPEIMTQFAIQPDHVVKLTDRQFLMPGFVDCHAHASQYSFLGTGTDLELMGWLDKYTFPTEKHLKDLPGHGLEVYAKCVDRTLRYGTTTISYYATIDRQSTMALVNAIESRGQRAFVGKVNMDTNGPEDYRETREQSVKDTKRFVSEMLLKKSPMVQPCITPRFALSCSMELMKELSGIAHTHGLPIQTHLSENLSEIQAVSRQFPDCASYSHVYDEAGLLGHRTMLAHAVHISRQELDLIRDRKSGICHCPNSNFSLTSGVMDLRRVINSKVKVGLGTDFGAGCSPSMLDAIRRGLDAAKIHRFQTLHNNNYSNNDNSNNYNNNNYNNDDNNNLENSNDKNGRHNGVHNQQQQTQRDTTSQDGDVITYKHLFRLATLGSSQVMGLDKVIGNFTTGKDFDAIFVDVSTSGSPIDIFPSDSREDMVQKFIFLGDDRNITRVYVQGRQVLDLGNNVTG